MASRTSASVTLGRLDTGDYEFGMHLGKVTGTNTLGGGGTLLDKAQHGVDEFRIGSYEQEELGKLGGRSGDRGVELGEEFGESSGGLASDCGLGGGVGVDAGFFGFEFGGESDLLFVVLGRALAELLDVDRSECVVPKRLQVRDDGGENTWSVGPLRNPDGVLAERELGRVVE